MRPIYSADLLDAARALYAVPPNRREWVADRIVAYADTADRYRKRLAKPHPKYGLGTVSSAAQKFSMISPPVYYDLDFLMCFQHIAKALLRHKTHQSM